MIDFDDWLKRAQELIDEICLSTNEENTTIMPGDVTLPNKCASIMLVKELLESGDDDTNSA